MDFWLESTLATVRTIFVLFHLHKVPCRVPYGNLPRPEPCQGPLADPVGWLSGCTGGIEVLFCFPDGFYVVGLGLNPIVRKVKVVMSHVFPKLVDGFKTFGCVIF